MRKYTLKGSICSLSPLSIASCGNQTGQPFPNIIVNGDFETGDFTGLTAGGINEGFAEVEEAGTCFSPDNTHGISMKGIPSTNVRTGGSSPLNSIGILTSDLFIAGNAIRFVALSENDDSIPADNPVTLEVLVLDDMDSILHSEIVDTNIVTLSPSNFPASRIGEIRDGSLSTHIIDTSSLVGELIRIEFRQRTNVAGSGFSTLIDNIEVVD